MAKKLKRLIDEFCGLSKLSREDRFAKAKSILDDPEQKQKICSSIQGLSFKEVEKALKAILAEKKPEKEPKIVSKPSKEFKSGNGKSKASPRTLEEILAAVKRPRQNN